MASKASKKTKKTKKKNTARKAVKKTAARKAPARKAKAAPARKVKSKKAAKAAVKKSPAKKSPVKKAAKKSAPRKKQIVGEGDYAASRTFLKDQAGFVKRNAAKIPAMAKQAERDLDGPQGDDLRAAEASARSHSKTGSEE